MKTYTVNHLSKELVPITVSMGGVDVTTGVSFSLVPQGADPDLWRLIDTAEDGTTGFLYEGDREAGYYDVFAKATYGAEVPVICNLTLRLT